VLWGLCETPGLLSPCHAVYRPAAARLQTMPVIEQAKGILMADSHCGDAQAFDLLRRASQRSNVPVRELAAQIVAKAALAGVTGAVPGNARRCARDTPR
jgi:hypothetical protein